MWVFPRRELQKPRTFHFQVLKSYKRVGWRYLGLFLFKSCGKDIFVPMCPFLVFYLKYVLFTSTFCVPPEQAVHSLRASLVPTMHLTVSGDAQERRRNEWMNGWMNGFQ